MLVACRAFVVWSWADAEPRHRIRSSIASKQVVGPTLLSPWWTEHVSATPGCCNGRGAVSADASPSVSSLCQLLHVLRNTCQCSDGKTRDKMTQTDRHKRKLTGSWPVWISKIRLWAFEPMGLSASSVNNCKITFLWLLAQKLQRILRFTQYPRLSILSLTIFNIPKPKH